MSLAAAALVGAIAFQSHLLEANEPQPGEGGTVRSPATIREEAPLSLTQQKQAQRGGRGAGFRSHRLLTIEHLEDRRLLAFTHPGLLHTAADFDRMAAKVAEGAEPWTSGWNALVSHGYSQLNADPRPLETVIRGGAGQNFNQMVIDIQRSYMTALRWKVTGDTRFADQTVEFLNAWSSTMTNLTGNADRFLAAGIYGYQWATSPRSCEPILAGPRRT